MNGDVLVNSREVSPACTGGFVGGLVSVKSVDLREATIVSLPLPRVVVVVIIGGEGGGVGVV